ncbi:unnamed protein product, partial [Polarella glacialis]
ALGAVHFARAGGALLRRFQAHANTESRHTAHRKRRPQSSLRALQRYACGPRDGAGLRGRAALSKRELAARSGHGYCVLWEQCRPEVGADLDHS